MQYKSPYIWPAFKYLYAPNISLPLDKLFTTVGFGINSASGSSRPIIMPTNFNMLDP